MKTTRTFKDLDLNFIPSPSSQDRYSGSGTIACSSISKKVYGTGTTFMYNLSPNDNLYMNTLFVGKVQSIESQTELTLFTAPTIADSLFNYGVAASDNIDNVIIETNPISGSVLYDNNSVAFLLSTVGLADGTIIPYKIHGVLGQDVYISDDDPIYTNIGGFIMDESSAFGEISGTITITNNQSSILLEFISENISQIRPDLVLELYDNSHTYSTQYGLKTGTVVSLLGTSYTYSSPSDVVMKYDAAAIKAALKNLILTMNYERPFNSAIGSQVRAIMFEPASPMTEVLLRRSIVDVIASYEPRVVLLDLAINMNGGVLSANITIYFQIINTTEPIKLDLVLERVR